MKGRGKREPFPPPQTVLGRVLSEQLKGFYAQNLADLSSYFLYAYFDFFSDIKRVQYRTGNKKTVVRERDRDK